ncbi:site-specific DNA-methyltransferase [Candidatus Poribacteria bacterium]|nr:site-specific DNA-methyltransferase [Candidatus Poribacteria bacterium]
MKPMKPLYQTDLGAAYCADSLAVLRQLETESADLVITSPPYALHFKKEYGNAGQSEYIAWFEPFAREIHRVLKPTGSFVLNLGGAWTPGKPVRSLYVYRLLLHLCDTVHFKLCQEFFWYNPAKLPAPAEWVNVRRIRVKDSTEYLFWLGKTDAPAADNTRVLQSYSEDMLRLIKRGVKETRRPSGHAIKKSFAEDRGGAIPGNCFLCGNNESNSQYLKKLKAEGRKIHPARFPAELPAFFVKFLTKPGDLVIDPFAGSNTTGAVAEALNRRWIAIELNREYLNDSKLRFEDVQSSICGKSASKGAVPVQLSILK